MLTFKEFLKLESKKKNEEDEDEDTKPISDSPPSKPKIDVSTYINNEN